MDAFEALRKSELTGLEVCPIDYAPGHNYLRLNGQLFMFGRPVRAVDARDIFTNGGALRKWDFRCNYIPDPPQTESKP